MLVLYFGLTEEPLGDILPRVRVEICVLLMGIELGVLIEKQSG